MLVAALLSLLAVQAAEGARILVVISMPAPSHLIVFTGLTRVLAERGHHITLCAPTEKTDKLIPTKNHEFVSVKDPAADEFKRKDTPVVYLICGSGPRSIDENLREQNF